MKKENERYYNFPAGHFCGVLVNENVMKKITKLSCKYNNELQKILNDNKESLKVSDWALANIKDGEEIKKQTTITYYVENGSENISDINKRVSLFTPPKPQYIRDLYIVKDRDEAQKIVNELVLEEDLI